ncbi:RNA polymerase sigma factor (sigma-70 family) [Pedobacter sp. UYP30]|uniref:RNA polymerase sigma factor n=1 Tax=Pedobacter sp. UYP30 TaxID=1756400 RepID=UPI0033991C5D
MKLAQTHTIDDLLQGCKNGERKTQELLYKQTSGKMMAVCMRYAKNRAEAEDVLQLGYIKVFTKINQFKEEGSFEGWIRRIMVNTSIENFRKNQRSLKVVELDEAFDQPSVGFDFGTLGMEDLLRVISKLSDGYRMVFNMYAIEGYSHREIAEQLGISESTSKSQLSRARAILKQEIIKMEGQGYATYTG